MAQGVKHIVTKENLKTVHDFGAVGVPTPECARYLGISESTFNRKYLTEYKNAFTQANQNVSNSLYNQARKGNVSACIWWEKTRQCRSEKRVIEGDPDKPITHAHVPVTDRDTARRIAYALAAGMNTEGEE